MTGTRPLDAVARVRRVHEAAAARELAAAQERARAESARASELLGYLHEYEAAPVRASAQWLANRTVFLGRLQEAVRAQAPYRAYRRNHHWIVMGGGLARELGQGMIVVFDAADGRVLRLSAGIAAD